MSDPTLRSTEELRCPLTGEELAERGADAARLCVAIENLEEERKLASREFREQIAVRKKELRAVVAQIRERVEERLVPCESRPDYEAGVMQTARLDTGEIVRTRTLSYAERQGRLFSVEGRRAGGPDEE